MKAERKMRIRNVCAFLVAVLACFALVGCSQGSSSGNSGSGNSNAQSQSNSGQNSPQPETKPTTTTAYLAETKIGDNNVVGLVATVQNNTITGMKVVLGNVSVSGNTTIKKNYSINTAKLSDANSNAFKADYGNNSGSIAGSLTSGGFTGTITVAGLGEFPVNAPVAKTKSCASCGGRGFTTSTGTSSPGASSKACSSCNGLGLTIAYKGTYI